MRRKAPILFHVAGDEIFVQTVKLRQVLIIEGYFLGSEVRSDTIRLSALGEDGDILGDTPSDEHLCRRCINLFRDGAYDGVAHGTRFAGSKDAVRGVMYSEFLADLAQFLAGIIDVHFALIDGGFNLAILHHIAEEGNGVVGHSDVADLSCFYSGFHGAPGILYRDTTAELQPIIVARDTVISGDGQPGEFECEREMDEVEVEVIELEICEGLLESWHDIIWRVASVPKFRCDRVAVFMSTLRCIGV